VTRVRLVLLAAVIAAAGLAGSATPASPTSSASPALWDRLALSLRAADIAPGRTAALAVDLETGKVVYQTNPDRALLPASAEKLAVSFAALRVLGPRFRFRTSVVGSGARRGRAWHGDLILVGHGDPTLAPGDLDGLARDVARSGIRRVTGQVRADETHFDTRRDAPGWKPGYLGIESRPLSALSVSGIELRSANGSAVAAAKTFTLALERRGVSVAGVPRAGRAPADGTPLAVDVSAPLVDVVRLMNRDSDNFVSEMVLKELGRAVDERGSTAAGARVVRSILAGAGVPLAGVRIADGSGLSGHDRLTVRALVSILRAGASDPAIRGPFVTSLAVAGIAGTLKNRLDRRPTRSRVIAKTGTTRRSSALAGFIRRRYVFAIVQNGSPVPYWSARLAQDRFVTALAQS
jgi:D-alanyl-D-alanine carboxypeptidase/D-alanyl-D-alanine-endopeptidase (penicillin-binding protein 4)